jgi:hypothetical protein
LNQEFEAEFRCQLQLGLYCRGAMLLSSWKTLPKPSAETLSADERNVLTARLAGLLEENNQLLRELAAARAERDALERALAALERNQKREMFDFILAEPAKGGSR